MSTKPHCIIDLRGFTSLWRWFDKELMFTETGLGERSRPGFVRVIKGLCLPQTIDQIL